MICLQYSGLFPLVQDQQRDYACGRPVYHAVELACHHVDEEGQVFPEALIDTVQVDSRAHLLA